MQRLLPSPEDVNAGIDEVYILSPLAAVDNSSSSSSSSNFDGELEAADSSSHAQSLPAENASHDTSSGTSEAPVYATDDHQLVFDIDLTGLAIQVAETSGNRAIRYIEPNVNSRFRVDLDNNATAVSYFNSNIIRIYHNDTFKQIELCEPSKYSINAMHVLAGFFLFIQNDNFLEIFDVRNPEYINRLAIVNVSTRKIGTGESWGIVSRNTFWMAASDTSIATWMITPQGNLKQLDAKQVTGLAFFDHTRQHSIEKTSNLTPFLRP